MGGEGKKWGGITGILISQRGALFFSVRGGGGGGGNRSRLTLLLSLPPIAGKPAHFRSLLARRLCFTALLELVSFVVQV